MLSNPRLVIDGVTIRITAQPDTLADFLTDTLVLRTALIPRPTHSRIESKEGTENGTAR